MNIIRIGLVILAAVSTTACATVTRGTKDAWSISTTPPGARVETTNGFFCASTPCALQMPRKSNFVATITKAGYKTAQVTVTNKIAGAGSAGLAGNVLVGGLIGIGVDAYSGAALDLTPNPVTLTLEKVDDAAPVVAVNVAPAAAPQTDAAPPATPTTAVAQAPLPPAATSAAPASQPVAK